LLGKYQYLLESSPKGIRVDQDKSPRMVRRILFEDSLLKFFPYSELYIKDDASIISDYFHFVEGLQLKASLGNQEEGYMGQDYCWSEGQINNVRFSNHIAGDQIFLMLAFPYMNNYPDTKAYKGEISDIVTTIAKDVLKIASTNVDRIIDGKKISEPTFHISPTINGKDEIWYQGKRNQREFIEYLSTRALTKSSNSISPYVTFINSNGEFYFSTLDELYKQSPVKKFKIEMNSDMSTTAGFVKNYDIMNGGLLCNLSSYKNKVFTLEGQGIPTVDETVALSDRFIKLKGNNSKFLAKKAYQAFNSISNYGIVEDTDANNIKGRKNFEYINSNMAYRMTLVDMFDPNLVTGKTVEVQVEKTSDGNISTEYSGVWLIIESSTVMDMEAAPYTKMTIVKPSIEIDKDNPFINDFL